jgi:tRNA(His) 5'-end guanylyltransferase
LDGVAFHTLTRHCKKPFDAKLSQGMTETAKALVSEIQGAVCAYTQSDEISVVLTDYNRFDTDAWYDYNIQKISSVAASIATLRFHDATGFSNKALFDCRAFNLPREEVVNYLHWRQKDWLRNSVQMLARSIWSQKKLHGKSITEIKEMLCVNGTPWENLEGRWRNGIFIRGDAVALPNLIVQENRIYIESLLEPEEK